MMVPTCILYDNDTCWQCPFVHLIPWAVYVSFFVLGPSVMLDDWLFLKYFLVSFHVLSSN